MNIEKLRRISRLYFDYKEIARALQVTEASARVFANRYVRQGLLVRVKRNIYMLKEAWRALSREELFSLANITQVPSYVSLTSALDYYGITTQVQRSFVESITAKRTKAVEVDGAVFNYTKIRRPLYGYFVKKDGFFIALPEKAFLDALYLVSLKKYSLDRSALDLSKVDRKALKKIARLYPEKTVKVLRRYGYD